MTDVIKGNVRKEVRLIPFVCGAGAQQPGTVRGPAEMQKQGLESALASSWRQVAWHQDPSKLYEQEIGAHKNLPPLGSVERRAIVLKHGRRIARNVEKVVKSGAMPVTLGGDHSMAAGSIAGFARAKNAHGRIGLIWVDAHGDIHTPDTSLSKAYHGMPVASLLGLGDRDFATIGGEGPVLKPQNVVYIGLRSTENAEDRRISDLGIHAFSMKDISGGDMKEIFHRALKSISKDMDYLVLSIDMDAFDPATAPAVGSPAAGGFQREEMLEALKHLARLRAPDMIEVVEFNPDLEGAQKTYALLEDVLKAALDEPEPFLTVS